MSYAVGTSSQSASYANGVYTLSSTGDWWNHFGGSSDVEYEFMAQPMIGDGTIQARVTNIQGGNVNTWVGVMLRTGPNVAAAGAFAGGWNGALRFQWRPDTGADSTLSSGPGAGAPYWMRLVRSGTSVSAYYSLNGVDWIQIGTSQTVNMGTLLYAGLVVIADNNAATATFDGVSLVSSGGAGASDFAVGVPRGSWDVDAGEGLEATVSIAGTGGFDGPVVLSISGLPAGVTANFSPSTVMGAGTSTLSLNTSASTPVGSYIVTVTGVDGGLIHTANVTFTVSGVLALPVASGVNPATGTGASGTFGFTVTDPASATNIGWVEALVHDSLNGVNACYMHYDVASNVLYLRDDVAPQWIGSGTLGSPITLANSQCAVNLAASSPTASDNDLTLNVALVFAPSFAGAQNLYLLADSQDLNSGWTQVGSWSVPAPSGSLPEGWVSYAIGTSSQSASYANGVYTLSSTGDWWNHFGGANDAEYEFMAQPMIGDGTIQARITNIQGGNVNTWVGVMLRTGPNVAAAGAFAGGWNGALRFQWRPDTGADSTLSSGPGAGAPYWMRLVRSGTSVSAYYSLNGVDWTQVGTPQIVNMGTLLYAGLIVVADNNAATATFDNLTVSTTPDFSFVPGQDAAAVSSAGGSTGYQIAMGAINGFTGSVGLSVFDLPSGVTGLLSPNYLAPAQTASVTLQVATGTAPDTYSFSIGGSVGNLAHSISAALNVMAVASATFVKRDTATQGSWQGVYGSDGYQVIDASVEHPSFVAVTPSGQSDFVWTSSTSDVRGLQKSATSTDRIAATWYSSGTFTVDLNFSDTTNHHVAIYCVDWDGGGVRAQTIDVLDAVTNSVLDSRDLSSFTNGTYLVWNVSHHVKIRFTNTSSWNAVVEGLFFDPPGN